MFFFFQLLLSTHDVSVKIYISYRFLDADNDAASQILLLVRQVSRIIKI